MGLVRSILRTFRGSDGNSSQPSTGELSKSEFDSHRSQNGYNDTALLRFRLARAKLHRQDADYLTRTSPGFLALLAATLSVQSSSSNTSATRILEYGGAFGHYRDLLQAKLPDSSLSYAIVEFAEFADAAQAEGFSGYVPDIHDTFPDIVFTSGTLQYLPNPLEVLEKLLALKPAYIILTRNLFSTTGPKYFEQKSALFDHGAGPLPQGFTNQHIPLYVQALPIQETMALLKPSYEVMLTIDNESGVVHHGSDIFGRDLICRRIQSDKIS